MTLIGELSLWVALLMAAWSTTVSFAGGALRRDDLVNSGIRGLYATFAMIVLASAGLWTALLSHDFSLEYVASHISANMPGVYVFTSFWSGQAGSMQVRPIHPFADEPAKRILVRAVKGGKAPLILLPPRKWLYARCDERFARMIDQAAVAEVEALLARKLNPNLPVTRAIGVRELSRYLHGEISLDEAIAAGRQATRRYAKRQYTWFAHQPPADWPRFREALDIDRLGEVLALL